MWQRFTRGESRLITLFYKSINIEQFFVVPQNYLNYDEVEKADYIRRSCFDTSNKGAVASHFFVVLQQPLPYPLKTLDSQVLEHMPENRNGLHEVLIH